MRQFSRFVPHLIVAVFAAWCLYSVRHDLAALPLAVIARSWHLVALALLLSAVNFALRSVRWRSYLAALGNKLGLGFAALTFTAGFAYTLSPGKFGEMIRARYYLPLGIPVSDVTASFLGERITDLLAIIAIASLLFTSSHRYQVVVVAGIAIIAVALATLMLVPWASVTARLKPTGQRTNLIRSCVASLTASLASTRTLLRPGILIWGFVLALLAWGVEGAALQLLGSMYPQVRFSVSSAIAIYGISILIGGLSFLPGGLGSTEAAMTALLVANGFTVGQGLVLTLICRLVTLWFAVAVGWGSVILLRPKQPAAVS
ncbi:MAG: lysylphosphatidylglycerol synthase transmembrane domain-containing protein [Steroidobacteraceae bacterium]